jgi:hypothetical protein
LSGQSGATALFSIVCYTLCDTYIDFHSLPTPKGKFLNYSGVSPSCGANSTADFHIPELMKFWKDEIT